MHFLIICKSERDWINRNREKVRTLIFRHSNASYSAVSDAIWPKFNLILTCMVVNNTYKNEGDPFKNEVPRVVTTFSHYQYVGIFPNTQGRGPDQILLNFKLIQDFMAVLLTCKNEEDTIKK